MTEIFVAIWNAVPLLIAAALMFRTEIEPRR